MVKSILKSFGLSKSQSNPREEIEDIISEEGQKEEAFDAHEKLLLKNILGLRTITAADVMVPRAEIIAVDKSIKIEKIKNILTETGLSKIPVYIETIDDIIGYIHSFDFLKKPDNLKELILPVEFVPEPMLVNDVLELLTRQRKSIAVVIDEYGGTSGIITVEDIVEELFGEIEDEHDNYDYFEKKISKNTYELSARLEIEYLNKSYNLNLPESDTYDTLGGLIVFNVEEIPKVDDEIKIGQYSIKIIEASSSKIEKVLLKKLKSIITQTGNISKSLL